MLLRHIATIWKGSEGHLMLSLRSLSRGRRVRLLVLLHPVLEHLADEVGLLELELRRKPGHKLVWLLNYLVTNKAIECLLLL